MSVYAHLLALQAADSGQGGNAHVKKSVIPVQRIQGFGGQSALFSPTHRKVQSSFVRAGLCFVFGLWQDSCFIGRSRCCPVQNADNQKILERRRRM